jgi:hypothetical protein
MAPPLPTSLVMRLHLTIALLLTTACSTRIESETGQRRTRSTNPNPAPSACDNPQACQLVKTIYELDRFPIEAQASTTFAVDGTDYSVVFFQFGDKDESQYATIVVDGEEYPLDGTLPYDGSLVAPDYYCDPWWDDCYYTGYDLDVIWDDYFIDWAYDTDVWFAWDLYDYYDYYWDDYYCDGYYCY